MKLKPNILIVEDNPADVILIKEILKESNISHKLYPASDGAIALQMLQLEGEYSDFPRPDLILLDMNLPKKDGKYILGEIKQDNQLNSIPIIIMTSSLPDIENNSYTKLVDALLLKPTGLDDFNKIGKCIQQVLNNKKNFFHH
jgi:CheY-like chemotaxis protein